MSVLDAVLQAFERDEIPLTNLISMLCGNAYMSGKTSGIKTLLRVQAPHMVDIGSGTCHVTHTIVKRFCNNFEGYHEKLLVDIHTDFKWSADLEDHLKDLCTILDITFVSPKQRRPHRWLSVYDCTLPVEKMLQALTLLYLTWVPEEAFSTDAKVKELYKEIMPKDHHKGIMVKEIHDELRSKNLTDKGKRRKKRLVQRFFFDRDKTLLHMYLYLSILKRFKIFVETFQKNQPLVHQRWDEDDDLFKEFLSHFIKMDVLNASDDLTTVKVLDQSIYCPTDEMYVGQCTELLDTLGESNPLKSQFLDKVRAAYVDTAGYMQHQLLSNPVLNCLSALDPKSRRFGITETKFHRLLIEHLAPLNLLRSDEKADYQNEVRRLRDDDLLPEFKSGMRLDTWWTMVFRTGRYPCLAKIVKACLSVFVSPQVSFSGMNDLISPKTNRVNVETFSALQNIRSYVKSKESQPQKQSTIMPTSLKLFHRGDVSNDPVDCKIARHMQKAHRILTLKEKKKQKRAATVETAEEPSKRREC